MAIVLTMEMTAARNFLAPQMVKLVCERIQLSVAMQPA